MVDFNKAKKRINEKNDAADLYKSFQDTDPDKATLGLAIALTGNTEYNGVDYSFQKEELLNEFRKSQDNMHRMCAKLQKEQDK